MKIIKLYYELIKTLLEIVDDHESSGNPSIDYIEPIGLTCSTFNI